MHLLSEFAIIRDLITSFRNDDIDFVDVLSECAIEDIPVPDVIKHLEQQNILKSYKAKEITALEAQERLEMCRMQPPKTVVRDAKGELEEIFGRQEIDRFKRITL